MVRKDLSQLEYVESSAFEDPRLRWKADQFIDAVRSRNTIGMVAVLEGKIVGYVIYTAMKDLVLLDRIAIHPDYQRRGLGRQLVARLYQKMYSTNRERDRIEAIALDDELHVHLFLRAMGFVATPESTRYMYRFRLRKGWNDELLDVELWRRSGAGALRS